MFITVLLVVGCGVLAYAFVGGAADVAQQAVDAAASSAAGDGKAGGAPTPPPPPAPPGNQITEEGRLAVPADVLPGTYKASVPGDSIGCYWARLKAMDGEMASVIANGYSQPGAKVTVTIKATDKGFETQGCGAWTKA